MSWFEKGAAEAAKSIGIALVSVGIPALITWWAMDDKGAAEKGEYDNEVHEDTVFRVMDFKDAGWPGQTRILQNHGVDPINYLRVIECIKHYPLITPITTEMVVKCEEKYGL